MLLHDRKSQNVAIAAKRSKVLAWLKSENFSTAPILAQVLGFARGATHRTLCTMARDGLIQSTEVPAGAGTLVAWGLTPHGSAMAVDPDDPDPDWSYFEPSRVSPLTVGHALDVQRVRLALTAQGWTDWRSDRELHKSNLPKIPDALARDPAGQLVAIEVERTMKTEKRYAAIMSLYLQMAHAGTIDRVQYLSPVPGMAGRLQRMFDGIDYVLVRGQRVQLEAEHHAKFSFSVFNHERSSNE